MRILITGSSGFIGAHAVDHFQSKGFHVTGTDIAPPKSPQNEAVFRQCDLNDSAKLRSIVAEAKPDFILHLGARTDTFERHSINGYSANTNGTRNLLEAANECPSVRRVIVTSSRLVCRVGYVPKTDDEYCPPNFYGQSKVETERITKSANLRYEWVLTRPTAIWGPGFLVPSYRDFFEQIRKGRYYNIGGSNPEKTFGYVKNSVFQMEKLLSAPSEAVNRKTFYIGDYEPLRVRDWGEMIAREFGRPPNKTLPYPVLKSVAFVGDILKPFWKNVPLTSYRLANVMADAVHDCSALQSLTGPLPYDLQTATRETVEWLKKNP